MSKRNCHPPHHESPHEMRLREIVDELVPDDSQKQAYLAFARGLAMAERRQPQASSHKLQASDFGVRTKSIVEKWFRRGLSGNLLWLIGDAILDRG